MDQCPTESIEQTPMSTGKKNKKHKETDVLLTQVWPSHGLKPNYLSIAFTLKTLFVLFSLSLSLTRTHARSHTVKNQENVTLQLQAASVNAPGTG